MSRKKQEQPKLQIVGQLVEATVEHIVVTPIKPDISFDAWFMQKGLKPELKGILTKHFNSRGFMETKEFDQGLADFGL